MFIALSLAEIDSLFTATTKTEIYKLAAERVEEEDLDRIMIFELCDTGKRCGLAWSLEKKSRPTATAKKSIRHWSAADMHNLLKDRTAGMTYAQLAKKYGRTKTAVSNRLWALRHGGK